MCPENDNAQTPKERPIQERQPEVNIDKGIGDRIKGERPEPQSWKPFIDQTDPIPPDGGSGVGDNNND